MPLFSTFAGVAVETPLTWVRTIWFALLPRTGLLPTVLPPATKLTVAPGLRTRLVLLRRTEPNDVFPPPVPLTEVMVEWPVLRVRTPSASDEATLGVLAALVPWNVRKAP